MQSVTKLLAFLPFFGSCSAVINPFSQNTVTENAEFDDIKTSILGAIAPQTQSVPQPYKYLDYGSFSVENVNGDAASLLRTPSSNNSIVHGLVSDLSGGPPFFTSRYAGSKVNHFSLSSIDLACIVADEVDVQLPQPCTIEFIGYQTTKSEPINQSFSFVPVPGSDGRAPYATGVFGAQWNNLYNVTMQVTAGAATPLLTVMYFDNVKYTITLQS